MIPPVMITPFRFSLQNALAAFGKAMAGMPVGGTPGRGGRARPSLGRFTGRERGRGAVMPGTFRAAVAAEMGQAFSPPYQVPIEVAVNGLLMAGAWFLLPRGWLFTLQGPLAFPVVLSSWMYADVPATNVLAPDRIRVLAALGDRSSPSPRWRAGTLSRRCSNA